MPLPKINTQTYSATLPVSGEHVEFRPFLVGEEKHLMMAAQSEDENAMIDAVRHIMKECVPNVDIMKLPITDIEYLFLQIRMKSKGESTKVAYRCKNKVDGEECNHLNEFELDLQTAKVESEGNTKELRHIDCGDGVSMQMKAPTFGDALAAGSSMAGDIKQSTELLALCIESIVDGDEVFTHDDADPSEFEEFIDSLNSDQAKAVREFFNSIPKLVLPFKFKCSKCGYEIEKDIKGLQNFFD